MTLPTLIFCLLPCPVPQVPVAVTADVPVNVARVRRLYQEAHKRLSTLKTDGPLPSPALHIHVAKKLQCVGSTRNVRDTRDRIVGCVFHTREVLTMYLQKDDAGSYVPLLIGSLDYSGQLYLTQEWQTTLARTILSTVDVKELDARSKKGTN